MAQLVDYIQSVCEQSTLYFYIPTLDALRRGTCFPGVGDGGQMFQIKPIGTITGQAGVCGTPPHCGAPWAPGGEVTVQTCREHQHAAASSCFRGLCHRPRQFFACASRAVRWLRCIMLVMRLGGAASANNSADAEGESSPSS